MINYIKLKINPKLTLFNMMVKLNIGISVNKYINKS